MSRSQSSGSKSQYPFPLSNPTNIHGRIPERAGPLVPRSPLEVLRDRLYKCGRACGRGEQETRECKSASIERRRYEQRGGRDQKGGWSMGEQDRINKVSLEEHTAVSC